MTKYSLIILFFFSFITFAQDSCYVGWTKKYPEGDLILYGKDTLFAAQTIKMFGKDTLLAAKTYQIQNYKLQFVRSTGTKETIFYWNDLSKYSGYLWENQIMLKGDICSFLVGIGDYSQLYTVTYTKGQWKITNKSGIPYVPGGYVLVDINLVKSRNYPSEPNSFYYLDKPNSLTVFKLKQSITRKRNVRSIIHQQKPSCALTPLRTATKYSDKEFITWSKICRAGNLQLIGIDTVLSNGKKVKLNAYRLQLINSNNRVQTMWQLDSLTEKSNDILIDNCLYLHQDDIQDNPFASAICSFIYTIPTAQQIVWLQLRSDIGWSTIAVAKIPDTTAKKNKKVSLIGVNTAIRASKKGNIVYHINSLTTNDSGKWGDFEIYQSDSEIPLSINYRK